MIRAMLNLRCTNGHRFYAPSPEAWENQTCGPHSGSQRCEGTLHPETHIESPQATDPGRSEHSLKAAGVNGLTAPGRKAMPPG